MASRADTAMILTCVVSVLAVSGWPASAAQNRPGSVRSLFSPPHSRVETVRPSGRVTVSWDSAIATCPEHPEDIARTVPDHVKYTEDSGRDDEWKPASRTWEQGAGDCEDFSVCVRDLCRSKGMSAHVYVFHSKATRGSNAANGGSHAVAIGERNGTLWMSSNGDYEEVQSMDDARNKLARSFGWWLDDVEYREMRGDGTSVEGAQVAFTRSPKGSRDGEEPSLMPDRESDMDVVTMPFPAEATRARLQRR